MIFRIGVVGFHHKIGPILEFYYPENESNTEIE